MIIIIYAKYYQILTKLHLHLWHNNLWKVNLILIYENSSVSLEKDLLYYYNIIIVGASLLCSQSGPHLSRYHCWFSCLPWFHHRRLTLSPDFISDSNARFLNPKSPYLNTTCSYYAPASSLQSTMHMKIVCSYYINKLIRHFATYWFYLCIIYLFYFFILLIFLFQELLV